MSKFRREGADDYAEASVFSSVRTVKSRDARLPQYLKLNTRLKMDGRYLLSQIPARSIAVVFFDPQYRGILDKMKYGNEGQRRGKSRCDLKQMTENIIKEFIVKIDRVLIPSGHLFLWIDKYQICQGIFSWLEGTTLAIVDLITWNKKRMGMGYRTRRCAEYLVILQTPPRRAKGVWKVHTLRDVWEEPSENGYTHRKPVDLQSLLIQAVSNEGDIVVDPAAGSFSVMEAANKVGRYFLGCDLNG